MFYFLVPFIAYISAGGMKFLVNCYRNKEISLKHIGLGGFPSTHNSISSSVTSFVGFTNGAAHPAFLIGLGITLIIFIDSTDLRNKVGDHAKKINELSRDPISLKENIGHSVLEAFSGIVLGSLVGFIFFKLSL